MSQSTLADITERLFNQFDGQIALPVIVRTVRQAKRDLDIAAEPAPPELVERLARQHLPGRAGPSPPGTTYPRRRPRPDRVQPP